MSSEQVGNVRNVLASVSYPGMRFLAGEAGERTHIRGEFTQPCAKTGEPTVWLTRRWYISDKATRSEIVQTCLKIVLTAAEHEARENFLYRGRAVFGPHLNVDVLWSIANCEEIRA